jgi:LmbE family N-acetylglucosaminyl deacetylase
MTTRHFNGETGEELFLPSQDQALRAAALHALPADERIIAGGALAMLQKLGVLVSASCPACSSGKQVERRSVRTGQGGIDRCSDLWHERA